MSSRQDAALGARFARLRASSDAGNATVEFVTVGVVLVVPLVYLLVVLARLQAAAFAVDAAARSSSRAFVLAETTEQGQRRAIAATQISLRDQGFEVDPAQAMLLQCSEQPCLIPRARVQVRVTLSVDLPGVPSFVQSVVPLRVQVSSTQVAVVDAFRQPESP